MVKGWSAPRLAKVVKALHKEPAFGEAMALLVEGEISARRPRAAGPPSAHGRLVFREVRIYMVKVWSAPRLAKVVKALHREPAFGEAMALLVEGEISARRPRTDDWFFERFGFTW